MPATSRSESKNSHLFTMNYRILPPDELIETTVNLPLSKSISNRALIISALTPGGRRPQTVAGCTDTEALLRGLDAPDGSRIDVGAAGTAMRFLTAYFAATPGRSVTLDGSERMRRRPIGPLVDALRAAGAEIDYLADEGFPPLAIRGRKLEGGELNISAAVSSQFISALMMIAPATQRGMTLHLGGTPVSQPYIDMTAELMTRAGAVIERRGDTLAIATGQYSPADFPVEADWSAASYWFEIAAISSGFVTLKGLTPQSLQGDARIAELIKVTGLTSEWTDGDLELIPTPDPQSRLMVDLGGCPDLAPTLAVTCCLLSIPFRFTGLSTLRIKETDRLAALKEELIKFGFPLTVEDGDTLMWPGTRYPIFEPPVVETYGDHRIAMAFAPAALFIDGLVIKDAEVVEKSYPAFWDDMRHAGFTLQEVG